MSLAQHTWLDLSAGVTWKRSSSVEDILLTGEDRNVTAWAIDSFFFNKWDRNHTNYKAVRNWIRQNPLEYDFVIFPLYHHKDLLCYIPTQVKKTDEKIHSLRKFPGIITWCLGETVKCRLISRRHLDTKETFGRTFESPENVHKVLKTKEYRIYVCFNKSLRAKFHIKCKTNYSNLI